MTNPALTRRRLLGSTMLALVAPAFTVPAFAASGEVYRDTRAPVAKRVADLLARMTLEEKAAQLRSMWSGKSAIMDKDGSFLPDKAAKAIPDGIGQIAQPGDTMGLAGGHGHKYRTPQNGVEFANAVQRYLVEKTRLGIPALFHGEAAHGLMASEATIFPIPTGLGSTWDPELVERVFTVSAREARARGFTVALTPVVDLIRDPRYGRCEEFFGEDPYHATQMGIAAVRGLQGRTRPLGKDRTFATLKHFVHGVPQGGLNIGPSDISDRSLRENFLPPFAGVIGAADPAVIMPSYNEVNGVPAHASVDLLQTTGRQRLGFKGIYMSDYGGVENLKDQHNVAATLEDAAVLAMNAGVAANLPDGEAYKHLPALVRAERITEAQVDDAVRRILSLKFEAGLFETPYVDAKRVQQQTSTPADLKLARTAAEKALILLKNDGILPLEPKAPLRLAVIGPNAEEPLYGGYSGDHDRGVGILAGVRRAAPAHVTIEHADGVWITPPDEVGKHRSWSPLASVPEADNRKRIAAAVEVAKRADVILLVVGDVPIVTHEGVGDGYPGDRSTLGLWGMQDDLVEAMIATGKPIIALLINGRPLTVNRLTEKANALLEGWYLGEQGGNAFADVLFGKVNPGGKLTVTFPHSVGEIPAYYNRHPSSDVNYYIEGKRAPLFPFGHGLSYTSFDIAAPRLARASIAARESVEVTVEIANTGDRAGDEVVQLYIRDDVSSVPRPVLELRGFQRVTLTPGERRTLTFQLSHDMLAFWDSAMTWTVEPGDFTISAGSSSASLKSATLTVQR